MKLFFTTPSKLLLYFALLLSFTLSAQALISQTQSSSWHHLPLSFTFPNAQGEQVYSRNTALNDYVLICAWSAKAGNHSFIYDDMNKLHQQFGQKELTIYGINVDEDPSYWRTVSKYNAPKWYDLSAQGHVFDVKRTYGIEQNAVYHLLDRNMQMVLPYTTYKGVVDHFLPQVNANQPTQPILMSDRSGEVVDLMDLSPNLDLNSYVVFLGLLPKQGNFHTTDHLYKIANTVFKRDVSANRELLCVGTFSTKKEADLAAQLARTQGYSKAYVATINSVSASIPEPFHTPNSSTTEASRPSFNDNDFQQLYPPPVEGTKMPPYQPPTSIPPVVETRPENSSPFSAVVTPPVGGNTYAPPVAPPSSVPSIAKPPSSGGLPYSESAAPTIVPDPDANQLPPLEYNQPPSNNSIGGVPDPFDLPAYGISEDTFVDHDGIFSGQNKGGYAPPVESTPSQPMRPYDAGVSPSTNYNTQPGTTTGGYNNSNTNTNNNNLPSGIDYQDIIEKPYVPGSDIKEYLDGPDVIYTPKRTIPYGGKNYPMKGSANFDKRNRYSSDLNRGFDSNITQETTSQAKQTLTSSAQKAKAEPSELNMSNRPASNWPEKIHENKRSKKKKTIDRLFSKKPFGKRD